MCASEPSPSAQRRDRARRLFGGYLASLRLVLIFLGPPFLVLAGIREHWADAYRNEEIELYEGGAVMMGRVFLWLPFQLLVSAGLLALFHRRARRAPFWLVLLILLPAQRLGLWIEGILDVRRPGVPEFVELFGPTLVVTPLVAIALVLGRPGRARPTSEPAGNEVEPDPEA